MKLTHLILLIAACGALANAQTASKPAATAAKPAATATASKLPLGIPLVKGLKKTAFSLQYQEIKIGAGAVAESNKLYKVHYTGWRAADGVKFDSSYDHPGAPVTDKDGKPVMGPDGKPKLGEPQPMAFPQGMGRLIPGFDDGFYGMRIGGKRRLFIPWQLAYGARNMPDRGPGHPGIPPKSDLIFDVELVDVTDLQMPPNHPGMGGMPGGHPMPGTPPHPGAGAPPAGQPSAVPGKPAPTGTPTPATKPTPGAPATPAAPGTPTAPTTPAAPSTPVQPPQSK